MIKDKRNARPRELRREPVARKMPSLMKTNPHPNP